MELKSVQMQTAANRTFLDRTFLDRSFLIKWLGFSLLVHLIAAVYSVGHHSADEYFQILEFASYKLGKTPDHQLATEFREQMRPWLQPAFCYAVAKGWQWIGVNNPFTWAMSYRIFSGLVGWVSLVLLTLCTPFWFSGPRLQKSVILGLCLIWYFPAFHVRPSSESLSSSFFLMGLAATTLLLNSTSDAPPRTQRFKWLGVGLLLGLAFEYRFQIAFMTIGLLLWLVTFALKKGTLKVSHFLMLSGGILIFFGLGRAIDAWGYGSWVMSPWNYVSFNLIRGEVSKFGSAPWWDIFRMAHTETWPVLGFMVAVLIVVSWIRHPKHILTWSQIPFFLVHEMIGHKEGRFFFPLAGAAPVSIALALLAKDGKDFFQFASAKLNRGLKWIGQFFLANNLIALAVLSLMPFARTVQFYEGVYQALARYSSFGSSDRPTLLYYTDRDPYILLGNPVYFYRPEHFETRRLSDFNQILELQSPLWLFDSHFELPKEAAAIRPLCQPVYQTFPPWVAKFNWNQWLDRTLTWTLYRCETTQVGSK